MDEVERQRSELELEIQLIQNKVGILEPEIVGLQKLRDKVNKLKIMQKQIKNNSENLESEI